MPAIPLPTLSTFGFVTNTFERLDFLLTHIFLADKFQTSLYGNNVTSVQWILEETDGDMVRAASLMSSEINNYLRRYYDAAQIDVSYQDEDPENSSSRVRLTIAATVEENGIQYQISRVVSVVDGRFKEFIDINNTAGVEA